MANATTTHLDAKTRTGAGKGFARRTRAEGLIPAVVYGRSLEKPLNIAIDAKALKAAIQTPKKLNTIIGLKIEGSGERTVLLKEYQMDPVYHQLIHADFIDVKENEQVKVRVPVALTGKAEGVVEGGILSHLKRDLEILALPAAIPTAIEVDVTPLKIGMSIHSNELKLPAGITVKGKINYTIAVVTAPEIEKVVEPVVVPGAEGAVAGAPGAPGAPGAAPGAPGAPAAAGAAPAAGAPAAGAPAAGAPAAGAKAPAEKGKKK